MAIWLRRSASALAAGRGQGCCSGFRAPAIGGRDMKCNRGGVAMALFLISACGSTSASQEEAAPGDSGQNAVDAAGSTDGAGPGDASGLQDSAPSDVSTSDEERRRKGLVLPDERG